MRRRLPGAEDVRAGMSEEVGVELDQPPRFAIGDKVCTLCPIRNDGSYLGWRVGEELIAAGEPGYVRAIGTFLQRFFIYEVDFIGRGMVIGMRTKELQRIEAATP